MNRAEMLERIASFGYGVYAVSEGFAVADLQDDEDGFYLVVESVEEAFKEMLQAELLTSEEEA